MDITHEIDTGVLRKLYEKTYIDGYDPYQSKLILKHKGKVEREVNEGVFEVAGLLDDKSNDFYLPDTFCGICHRFGPANLVFEGSSSYVHCTHCQARLYRAMICAPVKSVITQLIDDIQTSKNINYDVIKRNSKYIRKVPELSLRMFIFMSLFMTGCISYALKIYWYGL